MCTQTSVVTPVTTRLVMPRSSSSSPNDVPWNDPLPGLSITGSSGSGARSSMMSWPYSPRIRMRPLGPGAPMRRLGSPRLSLAGGQSDRSGTCPSRVWITVRPTARAVSSTFLSGGTTACRWLTSLPSVSPKPPGSTKSRCMSMITSAVLAGSNVNGYGSAATVFTTRFSQVVASMTDVESDTQPNTPPCMVTMCSAAAWLPGSVAPVQSDRIRHS